MGCAMPDDMFDVFLSDDDLEKLTGYSKKTKQIDFLKNNKIEYSIYGTKKSIRVSKRRVQLYLNNC